MSPSRLSKIIGPLVFLFALPVPSYSHDLWIARQGLHNAAGLWCCGEQDCGVVMPEPIGRPDGWHVDGIVRIEATGRGIVVHEIVPYSETLPSEDNKFWRCHVMEFDKIGDKKRDGPRRCFFAPPRGM